MSKTRKRLFAQQNEQQECVKRMKELDYIISQVIEKQQQPPQSQQCTTTQPTEEPDTLENVPYFSQHLIERHYPESDFSFSSSLANIINEYFPLCDVKVATSQWELFEKNYKLWVNKNQNVLQSRDATLRVLVFFMLCLSQFPHDAFLSITIQKLIDNLVFKNYGCISKLEIISDNLQSLYFHITRTKTDCFATNCQLIKEHLQFGKLFREQPAAGSTQPCFYKFKPLYTPK
jgi:hypothetical protein